MTGCRDFKGARSLRILLLSWEFPPRIVGGLGKHVHRLSMALADAGHTVHVVTRDHPDAPAEEEIDGVHVMRVGEYPPVVPFEELIPWVMQFNVGVLERATKLLLEEEVDLVHAHDWLVAYAAAGVKNLFDLPLVSTIHATEFGRHQGYLPGPMNKLIHQIEWWLTYESRRTITCSQYMHEQIREIFGLPEAKLDVIPNGVDLETVGRPEGVEGFRRNRVGLAPGEKMIFFAGRLEYEKGVQTVLDALPLVLEKVPVRFIVAGIGTHEDALREHTRRDGLDAQVEFTGFVSDDDLRMYYAAADLAVVPSLYEPFGMVALETMAAGTPCIAADTGGLRELVVHDATGLRFSPGDPASLATAILRLLTDSRLDRRLTLDARRWLNEGFSWESIAERTVDVYAQAIREERDLRRTQRRDERPPLRAILRSSDLLGLASEPAG
jgi:glycogen(starch) synthase